MPMRNRGISLNALFDSTDQAKLNMSADGFFTFYHYTHASHLCNILAEGLWARREVACPQPPTHLSGTFLIEGFIDPFPDWLTQSKYYDDLGALLTIQYIGEVLLEISVPVHAFQIYIADYAHILECKRLQENKGTGVGFGYDCRDGKECTQAYVDSYVELNDYRNQHHAPIVQVVRRGEGIVIPHHYIKVSASQPRSH